MPRVGNISTTRPPSSPAELRQYFEKTSPAKTGTAPKTAASPVAKGLDGVRDELKTQKTTGHPPLKRYTNKQDIEVEAPKGTRRFVGIEDNVKLEKEIQAMPKDLEQASALFSQHQIAKHTRQAEKLIKGVRAGANATEQVTKRFDDVPGVNVVGEALRTAAAETVRETTNTLLPVVGAWNAYANLCEDRELIAAMRKDLETLRSVETHDTFGEFNNLPQSTQDYWDVCQDKLQLEVKDLHIVGKMLLERTRNEATAQSVLDGGKFAADTTLSVGMFVPAALVAGAPMKLVSSALIMAKQAHDFVEKKWSAQEMKKFAQCSQEEFVTHVNVKYDALLASDSEAESQSPKLSREDFVAKHVQARDHAKRSHFLTTPEGSQAFASVYAAHLISLSVSDPAGANDVELKNFADFIISEAHKNHTLDIASHIVPEGDKTIPENHELIAHYLQGKLLKS